VKSAYGLEPIAPMTCLAKIPMPTVKTSMNKKTRKNAATRSLLPCMTADPAAWPLSWNGEKSLVNYGNSFLRERDVGPQELQHRRVVTSLRLAAGTR